MYMQARYFQHMQWYCEVFLPTANNDRHHKLTPHKRTYPKYKKRITQEGYIKDRQRKFNNENVFSRGRYFVWKTPVYYVPFLVFVIF